MSCSTCAWAIAFGFINTPPVCGGTPDPPLGALQHTKERRDQPSPFLACTPASGRSNCHPGDFNLEPSEGRWGRDHPREDGWAE